MAAKISRGFSILLLLISIVPLFASHCVEFKAVNSTCASACICACGGELADENVTKPESDFGQPTLLCTDALVAQGKAFLGNVTCVVPGPESDSDSEEESIGVFDSSGSSSDESPSGGIFLRGRKHAKKTTKALKTSGHQKEIVSGLGGLFSPVSAAARRDNGPAEDIYGGLGGLFTPLQAAPSSSYSRTNDEEQNDVVGELGGLFTPVGRGTAGRGAAPLNSHQEQVMDGIGGMFAPIREWT